MGRIVEFIDPLDGCQSRQPVHPTDWAPATTRGQKQINQEYGRLWRILNTQQNARGIVEYWRDPIVSCFMNHQLAQCPRHAHGHVAEGGVLWLSDGMPRQNAAQWHAERRGSNGIQDVVVGGGIIARIRAIATDAGHRRRVWTCYHAATRRCVQPYSCLTHASFTSRKIP